MNWVIFIFFFRFLFISYAQGRDGMKCFIWKFIQNMGLKVLEIAVFSQSEKQKLVIKDIRNTIKMHI